MRNITKLFLGIIGFILLGYGLITAIFYSNIFWYSFFVVGGTLFVGYVNYVLKGKSIFSFNKKEIIKTYLFYLISALAIDFVGRFILNLWQYPFYDVSKQVINVFLVGYPFAFFLIYETFILIKFLFRKPGLSFILTMIISAFAHEIPNTFAWEWKYIIPYISFEILKINIVVIVGWAILIIVPIVARKIPENKSKKWN
jgi:hypothetical protein